MASRLNIINIDASPVYQTYAVSFFGDQIVTTVTADGDTVTRWLNELEGPHLLLVGVGVHFRHFNEFIVATLELCIGSRCLIYQIEHVTTEYPDALFDFLENRDYTFVGWKISYHLNRLDWDQALDIPRAIAVDLNALMTTRYSGSWRDAKLSELAEMVLGKGLEGMPENVMMLRWDLRLLTAEQVKHACVEAFVSFEIGRVLNACQYRLTARVGDQDSTDEDSPDEDSADDDSADEDSPASSS